MQEDSGLGTAETLGLGTPWGWALQGLGTPTTLWGWALQSECGVGHFRETLGFGVGHSRDERGVDRARRRVPGEELSLKSNNPTPRVGNKAARK